MNSDEIQRVTGCSRATCATIIGEQLGVDRVISSSFMKIDEDYYVVAANLPKSLSPDGALETSLYPYVPLHRNRNYTKA